MKIKKHESYSKIPEYQFLCKKSDTEMARLLKIPEKKYRDKIEGYSDFNSEQGKMIAQIFGVSQDEIFL